jgi:hypothetical protein
MKPPKYVTIFRSAFALTLRTNVPSNLQKYERNDAWAASVGNRISREFETKFEMRNRLELDEPDNGNHKDLENAIRIHKAFRQLTPLQARDPRLWTRLGHVDLWAYMRKRWPVERFAKNRDKAVRFIEARYFVPQSQSRALLRNGIARLWWTAHLSHDPSRKNPYELTAVLLSTLDITQQILERNMGRSRSVLLGFLEFLLVNKRLLLSGGDENRVRIRKLAKFLNVYGGVAILDCLSQAEITKLLNSELRRIED